MVQAFTKGAICCSVLQIYDTPSDWKIIDFSVVIQNHLQNCSFLVFKVIKARSDFDYFAQVLWHPVKQSGDFYVTWWVKAIVCLIICSPEFFLWMFSSVQYPILLHQLEAVSVYTQISISTVNWKVKLKLSFCLRVQFPLLCPSLLQSREVHSLLFALPPNMWCTPSSNW